MRPCSNILKFTMVQECHITVVFMNFNGACTLKLNFWIIEFKIASFTTVFMAAAASWIM